MFPYLSPPAKNAQGRWLWMVGSTAFLITTLLPLLVGALLSDVLGGWTINSLITCCVKQPESVGEAIVLLCILLALPFLLSLLVVLLWRRTLRSGRPLTARRGLFTFFLADLLAGISGFLLVTLFVLLPAIFLLNREAYAFLWLALCTVIVVQTLSSLPFLLLAGALLMRWQAREPATAV